LFLGLGLSALAYFRGPLPDNYRRRLGVSLLNSEWDQVVPPSS